MSEDCPIRTWPPTTNVTALEQDVNQLVRSVLKYRWTEDDERVLQQLMRQYNIPQSSK